MTHFLIGGVFGGIVLVLCLSLFKNRKVAITIYLFLMFCGLWWSINETIGNSSL